MPARSFDYSATGTLPLRFRRESFEFRLPIKLKCNFPSSPPPLPFPLTYHRRRPSVFISLSPSSFSLCFPLSLSPAITLYLSRTFGAITSEAPRYYDAYCSFTARNVAGGVVLATRWGQSASVTYRMKHGRGVLFFCCRMITKKRNGRDRTRKSGPAIFFICEFFGQF